MRRRSTSSPALLDIRFSDGAPFRTKREHKEALSLIQRLVAAPGVGIAESEPSAVTLEALTGGRSAAHVFKLTPLFGPEGQVKGTPIVVKISLRAEGLSEKAKYECYVRSGLPAACRPALLGFARAGDRAGLCYSFVGNRDGSRLETLTDRLQHGDTAALALVLRGIFKPLRRTWYGPEMIRAQRDIARYYLERFFADARGAARDEAILRACAARYFDARRQDGGYAIGEAWFPSPYGVLFAGGPGRPYHSCILHGDLNTDNILVGRDREPGRGPGRIPGRARVTLIDFLKTGRGHVYQDLAFLEAGVRINYPPDASFDEIVETEQLIALGRRPPRASPYAAAIRAIRNFAFRSFGALEDKATYHFAIAALGLRLMQATDLSDIARARITISALWAAKALAEEGAA